MEISTAVLNLDSRIVSRRQFLIRWLNKTHGRLEKSKLKVCGAPKGKDGLPSINFQVRQRREVLRNSRLFWFVQPSKRRVSSFIIHQQKEDVTIHLTNGFSMPRSLLLLFFQYFRELTCHPKRDHFVQGHETSSNHQLSGDIRWVFTGICPVSLVFVPYRWLMVDGSCGSFLGGLPTLLLSRREGSLLDSYQNLASEGTHFFYLFLSCCTFYKKSSPPESSARVLYFILTRYL